MEAGTLNYENLTSVLTEYAQALVNIYKEKLSSNDVNASDNLYNSVKFQINKRNQLFEVNLTLANYWKYVEYGRKAGKFPPLNSIAEWVKIKPVLPNTYDGKLPSEKQLSFLIARKIANEGIKPRPLLQNSIDEVNELYMNKIQIALTKDIEIEFDDMFKILRVKSGL